MSNTLAVPSEAQFMREALRALEIGRALCGCPNHYHPVWGCLKAAGLFRSLYHQTPFFEARLRPYMKPGMHLLIAGTADACAFEMLRTIAGGIPVRFTVTDRCAAPLRLVTEAAQASATMVHTHQSDLSELATDDPWDLVFVHYTLSFMDAQARGRVLNALARGLSADGVVICGVKFEEPTAAKSTDADDGWLDGARARLAATFHHQPAVIAELGNMLPAYATARAAINRAEVPLPVIETELAAAGLAILERHEDPGLARVAADGMPPSARQRWILVLGRAR